MGSLGDGLKAIRTLAGLLPAVPEKPCTAREMFFQDLIYEAQKFLIYRTWKLRDRQELALHRIRSIAGVLRSMD